MPGVKRIIKPSINEEIIKCLAAGYSNTHTHIDTHTHTHRYTHTHTTRTRPHIPKRARTQLVIFKRTHNFTNRPLY